MVPTSQSKKNGTLLTVTIDYTVSGNTVTLTTGAVADDEIEINPEEYNFFRSTSTGWTKYTTGVTQKMKDGTLDVTRVRHAVF